MSLFAIAAINCAVNPKSCQDNERPSQSASDSPSQQATDVGGNQNSDAGSGFSTKRDASAENACTHGRNVLRDAFQGVLSVEELREKTRQIWSSAQYTENTAIRENARRMLAALNFDQGTEWLGASTDFLSSCKQAGL